jgi:four helix bundle protein
LLRVLLDTNVLVSAAMTSGLCRHVVRLVNFNHRLVVSELVIEELEKVFRDKLDASEVVLRRSELLLEDAEVAATTRSSDSTGATNDTLIIQTAAAAEVDVLVTGDNEMRRRAGELGLLAISPRGFLDLVSRSAYAYPLPEDKDDDPMVSEPKENPIKEKAFQFALKTIHLYQQLQDQREYVLSKQLLRSGTSIGANVEEAMAAESRRDFIHKLNIASKEARETNYWLRLLQESDLAQGVEIAPTLSESLEIVKMLTAIVKTTSKNLNR